MYNLAVHSFFTSNTHVPHSHRPRPACAHKHLWSGHSPFGMTHLGKSTYFLGGRVQGGPRWSTSRWPASEERGRAPGKGPGEEPRGPAGLAVLSQGACLTRAAFLSLALPGPEPLPHCVLDLLCRPLAQAASCSGDPRARARGGTLAGRE